MRRAKGDARGRRTGVPCAERPLAGWLAAAVTPGWPAAPAEPGLLRGRKDAQRGEALADTAAL